MLEYDRKNVLCVGSLDVPRQEFAVRGLSLVKIVLEDASKHFNESRAIIVAEPLNKIGSIRESVALLKSATTDYGLCLVVIIPPSAQHLDIVARMLKELQLSVVTQMYTADAISSVAQSIYDFDPGPPLGAAEIYTDGFTLPVEYELLLRKSFFDCKSIHLRDLVGGMDACGVYCVNAFLTRSVVGPRPMPFFIKISAADKIATEKSNYQEYADFFIPFYLRPNLDTNRCASAGNLASIVGNFVEDSQPLRSALRANPGPGILFSLFENTLKGFRLQPHESPTTYEGGLSDFIKERTSAGKIPDEVTSLALKEMNLRAAPVELEKTLWEAVKDRKCVLAPFHGDLHSGNVMVRGKDAILIDFSAVRHGPISADVATLEVSLVFGTDLMDKWEDFDSWKNLVDEIYQGVSQHQPPMAEKAPNSHSWLRRATREIHHIAICCQCEAVERKAVLAAYLIRFARKKSEQFENQHLTKLALYRHAYALVVAERIIQSLIDPK
jgi:hypothetical protein